MNQQDANKLIHELGALILLDAPPQIQLGIDNIQWVIGSKFKGLKLIPLGTHFIHYSLASEKYQFKIGFFCIFTPQKKIIVKRWNPQIEDFLQVDTEEHQNYEHAFLINDLDHYLGPYPHEKYEVWSRVSNYITQDVLDKLDPVVPQLYTIQHEYQKDKKQQQEKKQKNEEMSDEIEVDDVDEGDEDDEDNIEKNNEKDQSDDDNNDINDEAINREVDLNIGAKDNQDFNMDAEISDSGENGEQSQKKRGVEDIKKEAEKSQTKGDFQAMSGTIYYTDIPQRKVQHKVQGRELTEMNFDKSAILNEIIVKNCQSQYRMILGEFQYAFVRFLLGENYESFEQWKKIFILVSSCEQLVESRVDLYLELIPVIYDQIQQIPKDFFVDPLSANSFVKSCLRNLFEICIGNYVGDRKKLSQRAEKLKQMVAKNFIFESLAAQRELNEDEDEPVIVEDFNFVQI